MDAKTKTRISKLLSLALRHRPSALKLQLDPAGWTDVAGVLAGLAENGLPTTRRELEHIVGTNAKQRFAFSDDGARLRANQGHSLRVDLGLLAESPPPVLYHGTVDAFADAIRRDGLLRGERMHVHLSIDEATAKEVASRRKGAKLVLRVDAAAMHRDGHVFFHSENGVWLTEHVPVRFLAFPE